MLSEVIYFSSCNSSRLFYASETIIHTKRKTLSVLFCEVSSGQNSYTMEERPLLFLYILHSREFSILSWLTAWIVTNTNSIYTWHPQITDANLLLFFSTCLNPIIVCVRYIYLAF